MSALAIAACADASPNPFVTPQDVPADVEREIAAVWERFGEAAPERVDCVEEVAIVLVDRVDGGDARYLADVERIEIAIPTSPRRFRESVVHELAHHLDATCDEFAPLRDELLDLLGRDRAEWTSTGEWSTAPEEIWAEALVLVVNGERVRFERTMPLPNDVVPAVEQWATARPG